MKPTHEGTDRRHFLGQVGAAGAAAVVGDTLLSASENAPAELPLTNTGPGQIPRKPFGRTNERVSIIGIGGHAIGLAPTRDEAVRIVHEAIDAGVNFLDNA